MTWKKISLELVPPLPKEEATREPWTRKEKLQALKDKASGVFNKILRNMNIGPIHENWEDYAVPHFVGSHPKYLEEGLVVRKGSGFFVPDRGKLAIRHLGDHGQLTDPTTETPSEEAPEADNVVSITRHDHDAPDDPIYSPVWNEYAQLRRAILELEGKIPQEPK